jgi:hypothetical protein
MTETRTVRTPTEVAGMRARIGFIYGGDSAFEREYRAGALGVLDWVELGGGLAPASGEWRNADDDGLRLERRYAASEDQRLAGRPEATRFNAVVVTLKWYMRAGDAPA